MKPIVAVLGLIVAAAAGAVGGIAAAPAAAPTASESAAISAAPRGAAPIVAAAPVAVDTGDLGRQIADLSNEVARLRAELAAVREGRVRETAVAEGAAKEDVPEEAFALLHRDAILRVIADEKAETQRKEDEARRQREVEAAEQRAERTAKELNMSTTETRKLAEIYVQERDKRDEFMKTMRAGDVPDRDQMRQTFQEYRDWRTNALTTALGADLAARVNEYDGDRMGFGGRFGDGGPGGGGARTNATGGAGGGNNNGGRNGRRNNNGTNAPANGGGTGGG